LIALRQKVVVLHAALDGTQEGYQVSGAFENCGARSDRTEAAAIEQLRAAGVLVTSGVSIGRAFRIRNDKRSSIHEYLSFRAAVKTDAGTAAAAHTDESKVRFV
jgi:hypothetical protein